MGMQIGLGIGDSMDLKGLKGIVGVEGIYDLGDLVQTYKEEPFYRMFVEAAFGEEGKWKDASPRSAGGAEMQELMGSVGGVVIAHSHEDDLVDWGQAKGMVKALEDASREKGKAKLVEVEGGHDDVWEKGNGVVEAIRAMLEML